MCSPFSNHALALNRCQVRESGGRGGSVDAVKALAVETITDSCDTMMCTLIRKKDES
jgi:hypothetical protein